MAKVIPFNSPGKLVMWMEPTPKRYHRRGDSIGHNHLPKRFYMEKTQVDVQHINQGSRMGIPFCATYTSQSSPLARPTLMSGGVEPYGFQLWNLRVSTLVVESKETFQDVERC